jgi:hypothetical protein
VVACAAAASSPSASNTRRAPGPGQRGLEVGRGPLQPGDPLDPVRVGQGRLAGLGQGREVGAVPGAGRLRRTGRCELAGGVLAQGVQHPVGNLVLVVPHHQPGGVDQPVQPVDQLVHGLGGDRGRIWQRERAGQDGQLTQGDLVRRAEQRVARFRDRVQGGARRPEQVQPVIQDLAHGQGAGPARGQLDGQREAVQPAAQFGHRAGQLAGEYEARAPLRRPRREQPHRVAGAGLPGIGARRRAAQHRHRPDLFARQVQHAPGGDDDAGLRRLGQHPLSQLGHGGQDVLGPVQHEQCGHPVQCLGDGVRRRHPGLVAQA